MASAATQRQGYHHGNLRQVLLDTGLQLTRTGGPTALVLRDVARRVGVSPNAAYRHFADRDALLNGVALQIQQNMAARMQRYEAEQSEGGRRIAARAKLRAVGLGYIEFAISEPGWFETAFADIAPVDPRQGSVLPSPLALLVSALDGMVAEDDLAADARDGAEWPCWSAVHGFALLVLHGPLRGLSPNQIRLSAERTVDAIISGLLDR
ncbi:MAG TPA: TetR/AcrR family transcriptional regulator [Microlunatus sp.]